MKTVNHKSGVLHVETEGCLVNIWPGLTDRLGRSVTSVEVIPDNYVGDKWKLIPGRNSHVIKLKERFLK